MRASLVSPPVAGVQDEFRPADRHRGFVGDQLVHRYLRRPDFGIGTAEPRAGSGEIAEREHVRVLSLQLGREASLRDHVCARTGERADAAGVVEVRVRQDHVADVVSVHADGG
ncbi:MAG: hypothetical protein ACRDNT_24700 [Streptosporangiaceae bacterium]